MRDFFIALLMALSMFCALPFPCPHWEERLRRMMLLCLPLVGLLIGGLWALAGWGLTKLGCPSMLLATLLTLIPYFLTGFLHLDGFMDCADAILSRRDLETRQKILKDSHVGSFAVIALASLLLLSVSLFAGMPLRTRFWPLLLLPPVTRAVAAAAVLRLRPMGSSSYAAMGEARAESQAMRLLAAGLCILAFFLDTPTGLSCTAGLFGTFAAILYGVHQLGGMSGDISGMAITFGEFCGIAVWTLL